MNPGTCQFIPACSYLIPNCCVSVLADFNGSAEFDAFAGLGSNPGNFNLEWPSPISPLPPSLQQAAPPAPHPQQPLRYNTFPVAPTQQAPPFSDASRYDPQGADHDSDDEAAIQADVNRLSLVSSDLQCKPVTKLTAEVLL